MALSIKSSEADRLARELTAATGESLTTAVVIALRERLERQRGNSATTIKRRLTRLRREIADLPVVDSRPADQIVGYDDDGLPR